MKISIVVINNSRKRPVKLLSRNARITPNKIKLMTNQSVGKRNNLIVGGMLRLGFKKSGANKSKINKRL